MIPVKPITDGEAIDARSPVRLVPKGAFYGGASPSASRWRVSVKLPGNALVAEVLGLLPRADCRRLGQRGNSMAGIGNDKSASHPEGARPRMLRCYTS
jgi:hypothetical protein